MNGTVATPTDTGQRWGQKFSELPAGSLTPERTISEQIRTGRRQIQSRFELRWNEISRSTSFIGAGKSQRMLQDLEAKAKQEMMTFNQNAKMQMNQLRNIDRLAEQGMIDNPDELKARLTFGSTVAKSMFSESGKKVDIMKMFGRLDIYSEKLAGDREQFRVVGEPLPKPPSGWLGLAGPLVVGAVTAHRISKLRKMKEKGRKGELQWWNPNISVKVPELDRRGEKTGRMLDEMGDWEKVKPGSEKVAAYEYILREEKAVAERKTELQQQFGISQRIGLTGTSKGGGFNLGVAESIPKPVTGVTRQRGPQSTRQPILSDPLGLFE